MRVRVRVRVPVLVLVLVQVLVRVPKVMLAWVQVLVPVPVHLLRIRCSTPLRIACSRGPMVTACAMHGLTSDSVCGRGRKWYWLVVNGGPPPPRSNPVLCGW